MTSNKDRLSSLEAEVQELRKLLLAKDQEVKDLQNEVNQLQSYGRRKNLRIHGLPPAKKKDKETNEEVMEIVKKVHEETGVKFDESKIYRAHRVGKPKKDKNGKMTHSVIVKFIDWKSRCDLYRARPTMKKKVKDKSFGSIGLDLTKKNLELLEKAREYAAKDESGVAFACADINCRLSVRFKNGNVKFFYQY